MNAFDKELELFWLQLLPDRREIAEQRYAEATAPAAPFTARIELAADLSGAMAVLKRRDHRLYRVVHARYLGGYSLDDIGERFGVGRERVRGWLREGMGILRSVL